MNEPLNNRQIRQLKAMAQRLDATVKLGKHGLSDALLTALNEELDRHELVKVRFDEFKEQKKELSPQIAERTGSRLIMRVGHVAVFYRRQEDPAKRRIRI